MRFRCYGVTIESDVPLPRFCETVGSTSTEIQIWLADQPRWVQPLLDLDPVADPRLTLTDSKGQPTRAVFKLGDGSYFLIRYSDGTEFFLSEDGKRIYGRWHAPLTLDDTLTYALGPILAYALRRQGRVCLHGSAVEWNGRATLFVGPAGAGKSTTACAMVRDGAAMITDDICALYESNGRCFVYPGQGRFRLWPSSAEVLFGTDNELKRLTPNWDKLFFEPRTVDNANGDGVEVSGIYLLENESHPSELLISEVTSRTALMMLLANTHGAQFLNRTDRAKEFHFLGKLAVTVPAMILSDRRFRCSIAELVTSVRSHCELAS